MQIKKFRAGHLDIAAISTISTGTKLQIVLRENEGERKPARVDSNSPVDAGGGTVHAPTVVVKVAVRVGLQEDPVSGVVDGGSSYGTGGNRAAGEKRDESVHFGLVGNAEGDDVSELEVDSDEDVVGKLVGWGAAVVVAGDDAARAVTGAAEVLLGARALGGRFVGGGGCLVFVFNCVRRREALVGTKV